ncbi:unnamed protein product [Didymodactylos carnosus]|uniref:C2 domain-containing protein n=1 Tax=Didymodactylos carnosus TaxID=1234261 RepID=A0A813S0X1_9BILA|nr:unnamed protein product [Didymodactylos carnosus]CAF0787969.1 unnamed protein product [Didymodactylos carnosus]CAF3540255.1 unnamed protein product [Didymodactylos carnosus]CAF3572010.1 unnamed protein product [Didymodactylos carnosus]
MRLGKKVLLGLLLAHFYDKNCNQSYASEHPVARSSSCHANNNKDVPITLPLDIDKCDWTETRTPALVNYPDLITVQHCKEQKERRESRCLPEAVEKLIQKGFGESEPYPCPNLGEWVFITIVNLTMKLICTCAFPLGRLWFFLEYNPYMRLLYLTILKARCLRSLSNTNYTREPTTFVRAEIIPTLNKAYVTDIVKDTSNPNYNSETQFSINLVEFKENVLKLTVHEIDRDVFETPIGSVYYPLDHLIMAQRPKGHAIWRNLVPGMFLAYQYGDPSAIGLIQIRSTVWYTLDEQMLNVYIHSLRSTGNVPYLFHVYVHITVAVDEFPVIPQEHIESSQLKQPFLYEKCGPIVNIEQTETAYDQLFRFVIFKDEFNRLTVLIDVYKRNAKEDICEDKLIGRTVLVSDSVIKQQFIEQTGSTRIRPEKQYGGLEGEVRPSPFEQSFSPTGYEHISPDQIHIEDKSNSPPIFNEVTDIGGGGASRKKRKKKVYRSKRIQQKYETNDGIAKVDGDVVLRKH